MDVCLFEWCMLSGRGLCDELITRPEESYRLWCVVCDLEKQTSWIRRPRPTRGLSRHEEKRVWVVKCTFNEHVLCNIQALQRHRFMCYQPHLNNLNIQQLYVTIQWNSSINSTASYGWMQGG